MINEMEAERPGGQGAPDKSSERGAGEDSAESSAVTEVDPEEELSEQEKMDRLIAQLSEDDGDQGADTVQPEGVEEPEPPKEEQEDIGADQGEDTNEDGDGQEELSEQEKMDRLISELSEDGEQESDTVQPEGVEKPEPPKEEQEAIGADQGEDTNEDGDGQEGLTEQEKMDSLISELSDDGDHESDTVQPEGVEEPEPPKEEQGSIEEEQGEDKEAGQGKKIEEEGSEEKVKDENGLTEAEAELEKIDPERSVEEEEHRENERNQKIEAGGGGEEEKGEVDLDEDDEIESDETDEVWEEDYEFDEVPQKGSRKKLVAGGIIVIVLVLTCALTWFMVIRKQRAPDIPLAPVQRAEEPEPAFEVKPQEASQNLQEPPDSPPNLKSRLGQVAVLREELLRKQEEIKALKQHYLDRIREVQTEILMEKDRERIGAFKQALKNKRIELGLRTIQRRYTYINKLNAPLQSLHRGSEELLYMIRLAEIYIQIKTLVEGIEIDKMGERMDATMHRHALAADNLEIDDAEAEHQSLETIWKKIDLGKEKSGLSKKNNRNHEIWKEICEGNFDRKHGLTELSLNAAKCLSQWSGRNLNLNRITKLSSPMAELLSQWQGDWLCLNGLVRLSPELAELLSQWQGARLSLNGLTELSTKTAEHLSRWQGNELELVGLKNMSPGVTEYLTGWEESGGKIYLPNGFSRNDTRLSGNDDLKQFKR